MRKLTLVLLPVLFILSLICTFHYLVIDFDALINATANILWAGFIIFSMIRIFLKGTFRKTNQVRGAYFGIGLVFFGSIFKIQHWPNSMLLLYIGCSIVFVSYILHFIKKASKKLFDWLKLGYVLVTGILVCVKAAHYNYLTEFTWMQVITAVALITVFYIRQWKGEQPVFPEVSEGDENVFRYDN